MAKPETTSITVRLPSELVKWGDDQPGTRTEVLVRALRALKGEGLIMLPAPGVVAELEAQVATLTKERDQWRDRAKAIVSAGTASQRATPAVDTKRAHVSGPLLASAVPDVPGTVEWCGLKGLDSRKSKG